jgi:uncharacterized repeat protein (TIGR01451 family)
MRKTSNLSTMVVAILGATLSLQAAVAQVQGPIIPYLTNKMASRPASTTQFSPPSSSVLSATPASMNGGQDVPVPDILSGGSSMPRPMNPAMTGTKPLQAPATAGTSTPGAFRAPAIPAPTSAGPGTLAQQNTDAPMATQENSGGQFKVVPDLSTGTRQEGERVADASPIEPGMPAPSGNDLRGGSNSTSAMLATPQEKKPPTQTQSAAISLGPPATAAGAAMQEPTPGPLNSDGPKLRVHSQGPAEISINKSARFVVLVENLEGRRAEQVIVGINFPGFVDIGSTLPSTGSKELTDGTKEPRLVWEIPIIEPSSTERIVIDVTPREAKAFDVDVEWTFRPIKGKSTVQVTQAQLMVQMSGPSEVMYGEKAMYHVTVSNPGNGTAENVVVMLPEALGGERASLGNIPPEDQRQFQVELVARTAGTIELTTTATADNNLIESDSREILVRRATLEVRVEGPALKYAGTNAVYTISVANRGDAMAKEVIAAVALPPGVQYVSGIDGVETIDGGVRWNVGMLSPGNHRTWQMICEMGVAGDLTIEAATRGAGELAATDKIATRVEAIADLILSVNDQKGPIATGEQVSYEVSVVNRGTRAARLVEVLFHFSDGIEPIGADGHPNEMGAGQVKFQPIPQIAPGQEIKLKIVAIANKAGAHRYRAQCLCQESELHEVAEGTTRFYGETLGAPVRNAGSEAEPAPEVKR